MDAVGGILALIAGIAGFVVWVAAIGDAARRDDAEFADTPLGGSRVIWIITIAVTGFVGGAVYYLVARPKLRRPGIPSNGPRMDEP